jgi:hypothetical protein
MSIRVLIFEAEGMFFEAAQPAWQRPEQGFPSRISSLLVLT